MAALHSSVLILTTLPLFAYAALILPNLPQLLSVSTVLNTTSNFTTLLRPNVSASELGVVRFQCQGARFGTNLNTASCADAWGKMPAGPDMNVDHTYAPRDSDLHSDFKLPQRYLSNDGFCAIDVGYNGPNERSSVDVTSEAMLEYCIGRLFVECVETRGLGASVSKFGMSNQNVFPGSAVFVLALIFSH